jgi:hypothetical protein
LTLAPFSEVVLRATRPGDSITAGQLAALTRSRRLLFSEAELDEVAAVKRLDVPPEDRWAEPRTVTPVRHPGA